MQASIGTGTVHQRATAPRYADDFDDLRADRLEQRS